MIPFDRLFPGRRGQSPRPRILKTYVGIAMATEAPYGWSPDDVRYRLGEAIQVVQRSSGRVGPMTFASNWPEIQREYHDLVGQVQAGESIQAQMGGGRRPNAVEISRAEEALRWQVRFLPHDEVQTMRSALRLWLICKALRRPFRAACRKKGLPYSTAHRLAGEACMVIAVGLMRDELLIDEGTMQRKLAIEQGWQEPAEEDEDARTVAFV